MITIRFGAVPNACCTACLPPDHKCAQHLNCVQLSAKSPQVVSYLQAIQLGTEVGYSIPYVLNSRGNCHASIAALVRLAPHSSGHPCFNMSSSPEMHINRHQRTSDCPPQAPPLPRHKLQITAPPNPPIHKLETFCGRLRPGVHACAPSLEFNHLHTTPWTAYLSWASCVTVWRATSQRWGACPAPQRDPPSLYRR